MVVPADFGFTNSLAASQGLGCFGIASSTQSSYVDLDGASGVTITYPSDMDYSTSFDVTADGMGYSTSMSLTCGFRLTGIINPEFVETTSTLEIYVYDADDGIVA